MFRAEHDQKIKRTRQIIGIQGNKIRSQSQVPGILQTSAGSYFMKKLCKKRTVLMIHIDMQNTVIPERIYPVSDTDDHTDYKWHKKCHHIRK